MAQKAVVDAVEARLAANWSATPYFGLNGGGEPPADGTPFLEVQYPVANTEQISIGSPGANVWREIGAIRFVLSIRRGQGVAQGLGYADTLAALFRGKQFNAVNTWGPSSPVLDDSNDRGNYWTLSFVVTYYFDYLG